MLHSVLLYGVRQPVQFESQGEHPVPLIRAQPVRQFVQVVGSFGVVQLEQLFAQGRHEPIFEADRAKPSEQAVQEALSGFKQAEQLLAQGEQVELELAELDLAVPSGQVRQSQGLGPEQVAQLAAHLLQELGAMLVR
jgi:hypothetical protein